ncbi:MAG: hypothetical protein NVSMB1_23600 [Polyangiales bacterium]
MVKLANVLGRAKAEDTMAAVLSALGLESLESPNDLYRFAAQLCRQGDGFVAAVGGLLGVHAVIHGATERASEH